MAGSIQVFNRLKPTDDGSVVTTPHTTTAVGQAYDLFATKTTVKTTEEWTDQNPALQQGFFGYDSTSRRVKIGDGFTSWNDLEYVEDHGLDLIRVEYGNEISFDTALAETLST